MIALAIFFCFCYAWRITINLGQKGKEHSDLWYFLRSGNVIFINCDGRQTGCKILPFARWKAIFSVAFCRLSDARHMTFCADLYFLRQNILHLSFLRIMSCCSVLYAVKDVLAAFHPIFTRWNIDDRFTNHLSSRNPLTVSAIRPKMKGER